MRKVVGILFGLLLSTSSVFAEIYKVKDKEGRVIYTDVPYSEYEPVIDEKKKAQHIKQSAEAKTEVKKSITEQEHVGR